MVHLVQCLCGPKRHAILAVAYEEGKVEDGVGDLRAQVAELLATHAINPWCCICRSPHQQWQYEDRPTKFETLEEALPTLQQMEKANLRARSMLGEMGRN